MLLYMLQIAHPRKAAADNREPNGAGFYSQADVIWLLACNMETFE